MRNERMIKHRRLVISEPGSCFFSLVDIFYIFFGKEIRQSTWGLGQ